MTENTPTPAADDAEHRVAEHDVAEHDHEHDGGEHETVEHGDHVDFVHDGHRHARHEDHYDEHLRRCAGHVTAPALDIGAGIDEVQSWLKKRVYQSYAESPAGQLESLVARIQDEGLPSPTVTPAAVTDAGDRPTQDEWRSFERACAVVVTGGLRFGMMIARPNWRAVSPTTSARASPSRRCRCQSSGRTIVRVSVMVRAEAVSKNVNQRMRMTR